MKSTALKVKPGTPEKIIFIDLFVKVFKEKKDFKLYKKAKELVDVIKKEWGNKVTNDDLNKLNSVVKTMLPLGKSFSDVISENVKYIIRNKEDRSETIQNFVKEQLEYWKQAIIDDWTDEQIKSDLGISEDNEKSSILVANERISALQSLIKAIEPLTKIDRDKSSEVISVYKEIKKELAQQKRNLNDARKKSRGKNYARPRPSAKRRRSTS